MGINLEKAFRNLHRRKSLKEIEDLTLKAYRQLLKEDLAEEKRIAKMIRSKTPAGAQPVALNNLELERIYHIKHIEQICIEYRLRFLDSHRFKSSIPPEAISKLKHLQRKNNVEITDFKIIAPARLFQLDEKDKDPILFIPLGSDLYYLVHKWGKDLHPLRKVLVYPFRRFETLFKTLLGLAAVIALCIPSDVMMGPKDESSLPIRFILFFYLFIAFSGLTALYGFSRMKNFNSNLWKSPYVD